MENDDNAKRSQQCATDKSLQNVSNDLVIISICEDDGDVEVIASKDKENSQHSKNPDSDLILIEVICPSQEKSNLRKRKRTEDDDIKV